MGNDSIMDSEIEQYYKNNCVHYFRIVSEHKEGDVRTEGYKCNDCGAELIERYKLLESVIRDASGKIIKQYIPKE
jgi:methionyl-tRNA synthetase